MQGILDVDVLVISRQNSQKMAYSLTSLLSFYSTEELKLSHNQLTGTLPSQLGELLKLRNVHLEKNNITGVVPEAICGLVTANHLQTFKTDCASGEIKCHCCTGCS